jgi:hypothetical protein
MGADEAARGAWIAVSALHDFDEIAVRHRKRGWCSPSGRGGGENDRQGQEDGFHFAFLMFFGACDGTRLYGQKTRNARASGCTAILYAQAKVRTRGSRKLQIIFKRFNFSLERNKPSCNSNLSTVAVNPLPHNFKVGPCLTRAVWRMLPNNLPPWLVVFHRFRRWSEGDCFEVMVSNMRSIFRSALDCQGQPSTVILDGGTLQSSCESGPHAGYGGYKKRNGSR